MGAHAQPKGTDIAETRQCHFCDSVLPYTPEHYPATRGKPTGNACRVCSRNRKRVFDAKYRGLRAAARAQGATSLTDTTNPPAGAAVVSTARDAKPGELSVRRLDIAKALRHGADRLNESVEGILATILEYAGNTQSPHHEWALKLVAERVIPKKLYEDLGSQAAGMKAGQGTVRPSITVIVQQAAPASPDPLSTVKVIEGEATRKE